MKKIKMLFNNLKKMLNKHFDIILLVYMIINVLYINIGSYFLVQNTFLMLNFSYVYILLLVINMFLIKYLVLTKRYKKSKIDIFLKLIIIFAFISMALSYNINVSLYGYLGRCEGFFAISYYISILFLSSFMKEEYKKIVLYIFLLCGFIQVIYSIFQRFNLFGVIMLLHNGKGSVYGFTTNSNFFGSLMILCISYAIGFFIDSKKLITNILFLFIACSFFVGLLLSNTLSAVVGLIVVLLFLAFYCIRNKKLKKFILLCILFGYIFSTFHFLNLTTVDKDLVKTKNETTSIIKGDFNGNFGTGRVEVWKKTIKVVPKYIIHGVGIDNFANINDGNPITKGNKFYDKAHNEYLQILVTMGIFSLISYLCLHFLIIKDGVKKSFKNKEVYLILPVIGYLIQAQFNISVLEVAPFFYIGLGFLVDR